MQVFSPGLVLALKVGALTALAGSVASLFLWRRYIALQPAIGDPVSLRLIGVWLAVIVLLGLSLGTAYVPLGRLNSIVCVGIAFVQAFLVWTFFMRLRWSGVLVRLIAAVGLLWLLLLIGLSLTDYLTRNTVFS